MSTPFPQRLWTSAEFHRMVEAGIVGADERLELLDGQLLELPRVTPLRAALISRLLGKFAGLYGAETTVASRSPLECGPRSLPEPDVLLIRDGAELRQRYPRGDEAILVVEFAEAPRAWARTKTSIYARAAVPVLWWIDLQEQRIEVHEDPQPDGRYRVKRVLAGQDTIEPPDTSSTWTVDELLSACPP